MNDDWHSEGVNELDIANAYWIPSIPNFAEIDAAIVVDSTLHAIQCTIEATHKFDTEKFWDTFASVILAKVNFTAIKIHFFVPERVNFTTTSVQNTYRYDPNRSASAGAPQLIQMSSTVVYVVMRDTDSIAASIKTCSSFDR
jgi:hypothetical protein